MKKEIEIMANGIRKGLAFLLASAVVVGAFDAGALADGKHNHRDEDRKPQGNVQQNSENYEWYSEVISGLTNVWSSGCGQRSRSMY